MRKLKKKAAFDLLGGLGIGIATLAIIMIVVFLIMSELASNTTVTNDANASAAIDTLQAAADDIPGWVPIVVMTAIGAILILMVRGFGGRR